LSIEEAKSCLLAIMYGARASEWHDTAIPHTIGVARARLLYQDPTFKALLGELEAIRAFIVGAWPHRNGKHVINDVGYGIDGREPAKCVLAHLLQGVEAKMLRAVVDAFPNEVLLLQHDGFASRRRLDAAEIVGVVYAATGYRMRVDEKLLELPPEIERSKLLPVRFLGSIKRLPYRWTGSMPPNGSRAPSGPAGSGWLRLESSNVQRRFLFLRGAVGEISGERRGGLVLVPKSPTDPGRGEIRAALITLSLSR
jgi:hypothetical protein